MKNDQERFCTLKDVAGEAGVSYATVSNYINRRELLNGETADRVRVAIDKLKYTPALTARHLKLQKTNTIGIIVPDIVNNYFAIIAKTVEEVMRENGFETVIYNTNYLAEEEEKALNFFISKRIRGLVLMSIQREFKHLKSVIENHRLPVVVIDNYVKGLEGWAVIQNNYKCAYRIVEHLIKVHGYTDIAFISSNSRVITVRERIRGYKQAIKDHGVNLNKDYLIEGEFDPMHGYRATLKLLDMSKPPRAISASTSMYSIGILKAIRKRKLRIPEDVAITSFDDYDFAEVTSPSITALERVDYRMGKEGAKILIDVLAGRKKVRKQTIRIDTSLIIRRSCGCDV